MEMYEVNKILENLKNILTSLEEKINLKEKQKEIQNLNLIMENSSFWEKENNYVINVTQKLHRIKEKINIFNNFKKSFNDLCVLFKITDENTKDFLLLIKELEIIKKKLKKFEIDILLNQPYDENDAILILHSGAGGTESQDWCQMLFNMYQKYAQKKKFKIKILHLQEGEEAGLKSVSFSLKGLHAYGYLKSEKGIHRLVRISPFDSNSRRHTSFASCEVLPEINEEIQIEIKDEDIRIDVFRSSGAGGQHVNTTDSAVRITHFPSNIVVNCQNERSQIKNKEKALQILKIKLLQLAIEQQKEKTQSFKKNQKDISWGHQIRSYIFNPYQMVKDHRTNYESSQINLIMDGEIDDFIHSFLRKK
ncbi:peptide chain release factor 2 [Texas Phoenix palm phytoplasma]|uniref:Peptide chain release factor 2 n=1 Tax=Texas Phoenix palm phytoplasma TaxID=176709 RepID=A0ABS5BIY4_9MOLU|nr:peptide chain release factor 2 [Texas Phoenix palm phytoplasma]MBP3059525.1 peptide chain release factor 2 [Texas Phoenix palm phytoplasma]